jgi:hypothetical protein
MAKNYTPEATASFTSDGAVQVHLANEQGCAVTMVISADLANALASELVTAAASATSLVELFGSVNA